MRHLLTIIVATTSLVALSAPLRAEVVIAMPTPPPAVGAAAEDAPAVNTPDDGGLSGEPKSVGDIALDRYAGARSAPRDVVVQPGLPFGIGFRPSRRFIWPVWGARHGFFGGCWW